MIEFILTLLLCAFALVIFGALAIAWLSLEEAQGTSPGQRPGYKSQIESLSPERAVYEPPIPEIVTPFCVTLIEPEGRVRLIPSSPKS